MNTISLLGILIAISSGCLVEKVEDKPGPQPAITRFDIEPSKVLIGDETKLIVEGENIDDCHISDDSKIIVESIKPGQTVLHKPSLSLEYILECSGFGTTAKATTGVTVNAREFYIQLDNVDDIKASFELSSLSNLIAENTLVPFSSTIDKDFIQTPKNHKVGRSEVTSTVLFDRNHSLLYGHEKYFTKKLTDDLSEECVRDFTFSEEILNQEGTLFGEVELEGLANVSTLILPDRLHMGNFTATTMSNQIPIPAGQLWETKFDLFETEASYQFSYKDYTSLSGSFSFAKELKVDLSETINVSDNPIPSPIPIDTNTNTDNPEVQPINLTPCKDECRNIDGKIVVEGEIINGVGDFDSPEPPRLSWNPEFFDPNHPFCNGPVYRKETVVRDPGDVITRWIELSPISGDPSSSGRTHSSPIGPKNSTRERAIPSSIDCKTYFSKEAQLIDLKDSWTTFHENALWFITAEDPSGCGFDQCANKVLRGTQEERFSNIEPQSNYCVNRWKNIPWQPYFQELKNRCLSEKVYIDQRDSFQKNQKARYIANLCFANEQCAATFGSFRMISENFDVIENGISKNEAAIAEAKLLNKSFLISNNDNLTQYIPYLSHLSLNSQDESASGIDYLKSQLDPKEDKVWEAVLMFLIDGSTYSSLGSFTTDLARMEDISNRAMAILAPEMAKGQCNWNAHGRFRKYGPLKNIEAKSKLRQPAVGSQLKSKTDLEGNYKEK